MALGPVKLIFDYNSVGGTVEEVQLLQKTRLERCLTYPSLHMLYSLLHLASAVRFEWDQQASFSLYRRPLETKPVPFLGSDQQST